MKNTIVMTLMWALLTPSLSQAQREDQRQVIVGETIFINQGRIGTSDDKLEEEFTFISMKSIHVDTKGVQTANFSILDRFLVTKQSNPEGSRSDSSQKISLKEGESFIFLSSQIEGDSVMRITLLNFVGEENFEAKFAAQVKIDLIAFKKRK